MKILKLTMLNLASLEGEQVIDFQQEPLKSSDLFSITGATGSGKSTILDAICLALYGCCPRFMAANKVKFYGESTFHNDKDLQPHDARNILSRGTKSCFAELLFLANDGISYKARWSCEVGRTNYQKSVRKLYKLEETNDGQWIEKELELEIKKGDNDRINRLIGLDYQQFVRTVMLAQGSFANFIKADDKDKALLLEKLTGTEIYTTIAQKIYEFYKRAADSYAELEMQVKQVATHLLSEEESAELSKKREELNIRLKEGSAKQKEAEAAIAWWEQLVQLQNTLATQELDKEKATNRVSLLAIDEKELALWDDVAPIQSYYTQQKTLSSNLVKLQNTIQLALSTKQLCETKERTAANKLAEAIKLHNAAKQVLEEKAPIISKAKMAKATLEELATTLSSQQKELKAATKAKEKAILALQQSQEVEASERKKQELAAIALKELEQHESMLEELKVIVANLKESYANEMKYKADSLALQEAKEKLTLKKEALATQQLTLLKINEGVTAKLQSLNKSKEQFAALDLATLQQHLALATNKVADFNKFTQLSKEQIANLSSSKTQTDEISHLEKQIASYEVELAKLVNEKAKIEKILPGLEEGYQLTVSKSAESMRALLVPTLPCPVCGATEHPYSQQDVEKLLSPLKVQIDTYLSRLKEIEQTLNHPQNGWNSLLNQYRGKVQGVKEVLKQLQARCESNQQERSAIAMNYSDELLSYAANLSTHTLHALEELLITAIQKVKEAEQEMSNYTLLQAEVAKLQKEYDAEKERSDKGTRYINELNTAVCAEESRITEQEKAIKELNQQLVIKREEFRLQVTITGWEELYDTNFEELLDQFRAIYVKHTTSKKEEESATIALKELAAKFVEQQKMLSTHQESERRYQEEVAKIAKRQQTELAAYHLLLNGADPFTIENELKEKVDTADKTERDCNTLHKETTQEVSLAKGNYESLLAQQLEEQEKYQQATQAIEQFIATYNLSEDGKELLTVERLHELFAPDREWTEKRKQLDHAKGEVKRLTGMVQKCIEDLAKHHDSPQKPVAQKAQLLVELEERKALLDQIDQERQTVSGRWMTHLQALESVAKYQEELKEKKQVFDNWKLLNDILGNKDGDNFRETAQIYTLQFLLKQANAQLALLSNRYRLEQVSNSLSIRIVDKDRADEVRNLSSLSGGETFLVSLSLALGLSSLSSRNISIQNLFVDEGFGTLDADSLNQVIDALSSLNAMQGKKVGVISHTAEMKERIHTQIRVIKQGTGGRSTIEIG